MLDNLLSLNVVYPPPKEEKSNATLKEKVF